MSEPSSPPRRPPIRALFFDIDDTLCATSEFARQARVAGVDAMCRAGLCLDREEAIQELFEVVREFSSNYGSHYDKLLARIPSAAYVGINPAILVAAAVAAYHDTKHKSLVAYEDVLDVLTRLRTVEGLTLGVITAGLTIKQAEKIWRLGIYPYLDPRAIFISDQIGISKPNAKLFLRACQDIGVPPAAAMYVGDHPTHDIAPAIQTGMVAVHMKRAGEHHDKPYEVEPHHIVHNFWDLLELLETHYDLGAAAPRA